MFRFSLFLALVCPFILTADDVPLGPDGKPLFGHSTHGDAFDDGPRQAAVLLPGMGNIDFPITTTSAEGGKFFNQGVGQLHGFWFYEAERSFRQAAKLDGAAAMPYWGMAMANINNEKRAAEFIKQAVSRRAKASPREHLYIDALSTYYADLKKDNKARRTALVKALERIVFEFPDDIEAKAFLMFQIWDNAQRGMPLNSHTAVAALAGQVFARNPMHPGAHHYVIHLWNHEDDRRALKSAAVGGQSAPGIAHLWHMPGHTFTKLRRYADAAWQQEAAARTDHAQMIAARLMPEQIHNYAHNNDWLVENLGFVGRVHDAIDLARNMIELPRLAPGQKLAGKDGYREERGGYLLGRRRLVDALVNWEHWDELLALDGGVYLPPVEDPIEEAKRLRAPGVAAFQKGDMVRGDAKLKAIEELRAKAKQERFAKAEQAEEQARKEKKPADQIAKAMADALTPFLQRIEQLEKLIAELQTYRALADGKPGEARQQMEKAGDVSKLRQSRLYLQIGDTTKATQLAREAMKAGEDQVLPLANLADILWRAGNKAEALDTFKKLRPLCAQIDIGEAAFARLKPLADELKLPADWRPKLEWPADTGQRPSLASLGPFRWHPSLAPEWSLPDHTGETRMLAEFKGRPVIVLFYLGSGCSHCIEQLNTFGPLEKEFKAAGIDLVAVSTEPADELHKTFAHSKSNDGFPFPILSDATLATFQAYRAFDDFENQPLHGTFLIDGNGLVRWQNISYQPFTQAAWLLTEARRLLSLPVDATAASLSAVPSPLQP
jgi:peroxiredoxin